MHRAMHQSAHRKKQASLSWVEDRQKAEKWKQCEWKKAEHEKQKDAMKFLHKYSIWRNAVTQDAARMAVNGKPTHL